MGDSTETRRRRDFNPEDFERLLIHLDPDPSHAWQCYDKLRKRLVIFFEHNHCLEAEELAEEVLDRVAKKLNSQEIQNIRQFAFGIARNVRREASRTNKRKDMAKPFDLANLISTDENPEDAIIGRIDTERKLYCFLKCIQGLPANERRLIFEYYPTDDGNPEEHRQGLAEMLGVSTGTLRTRMSRLRKQLEKCFKKCSTHVIGSAPEVRDSRTDGIEK